ncbi:hypothetical protein COT72_01545 [archaeon CG10_big_fil_rev_8_21_14_0_10_43_11]|nr:MAG: hypothetical protein COT72_01545 [archaeon CG10_big_fil_rev_8_21_14_0_10_43_11]
MGSVLRTDYFGNFVLIATNRKFRPKQFVREDKHTSGKTVFAPGNEHLTPPETDREEKAGKWIMRSVPNKYSFVPDGQTHEVIIETPKQNQRFSQFTPSHAHAVFAFYQKRIKAVTKHNHAYLFKNAGSYAGASIPHEHSQLVTLARLPKELRERKRVLDFKKIKQTEKEYSIKEDDTTFAYCPRASRFPLEAWIVCKREKSALANLSSREMHSIATCALLVTKKLDKKLNKPSLNFFHYDCAPNYHIQIIPRITTLAGMELGARTYINEIAPEQAVRFYAT